jgi:putative peptidoglycan lipid II flippase
VIKGFRQIAVLTTLSRVLGMVRDMTFAYFFGATDLMDGWAVAFKIPNLARRLFGEGAATSSLIPIYSEEYHKNKEKANRMAFSVVTVVFVLLIGAVLIGEGIIWFYYKFFAVYPGTRLKLVLSGIMLPYAVLICVAAILSGILNAHRHFAAPAVAPVLLNILIIGSLCLSGWVLRMNPGTQVFILTVAVLFAGLTQLFIQFPPLWAMGISVRPAWDVGSEGFKKIMFLMGPMVLGLTATQINTLADDLIALWFSGSAEKGSFFHLFGQQIQYPMWAGSVSHLFYAQRLYQFPLGVFGISLATAIFPIMSSDAARKDLGALCGTVSRGLRCSVFVALPATVGLLLLSVPIVSVIFQRGEFTSHDTRLTAMTLSFYVLGLCGYFGQQVLTRAFYAIQDSRVPAKSAVMAVVANVVMNLTFMWFLGTGGLAASTALSSYLQVVILVVALRRKLGRSILEGLMPAVSKTIVATVFMGASVFITMRLMRGCGNLLMVLVAVTVGCGIYILASKLLRIEMLSLLTGSRETVSTKT